MFISIYKNDIIKANKKRKEEASSLPDAIGPSGDSGQCGVVACLVSSCCEHEGLSGRNPRRTLRIIKA